MVTKSPHGPRPWIRPWEVFQHLYTNLRAVCIWKVSIKTIANEINKLTWTLLPVKKYSHENKVYRWKNQGCKKADVIH